jgi:outer membrane murein-binding lipoprotein Lpp
MRVRLTLAAVASLALVSACQREPSFDEKFEQQSRDLSAKARKIEAETKAQLDAAREAEQAAAELDRSQSVAAPAELTAD